MYENKVVEVEQLIEGQNRWRDTCINLDKIVKFDLREKIVL